ncbi:MAG TPA: class I SAM-dependent methyltransferase [Devosiaceae bacterium]|nr:class I SAM-dependent methyltransferase [Devosiaceae bacterium]
MSGRADSFAPIFEAIRSGDLPPRIGYLRLAMAAETPEELAMLLSTADSPELEGVAARHPDGWQMVKKMLSAVSHDPIAGGETDRVNAIAAMFDRAARLSPEASVALYSLGDPEALAAATEEIVAWLRLQDLLGSHVRLLDFGCGIGRLAMALAPEVGSATGIDVSSEMIAEARRRGLGFTNLRFEQSSGRDLACYPDAGFDLAIALDSFPYVVAAGDAMALRLLGELARVLAPSGHLMILNYSYRGNPAHDREELSQHAAITGLALRSKGERPFALWDGLAFHLTKPSETSREQPRQLPTI